jgi:hypothetical protein
MFVFIFIDDDGGDMRDTIAPAATEPVLPSGACPGAGRQHRRHDDESVVRSRRAGSVLARRSVPIRRCG